MNAYDFLKPDIAPVRRLRSIEAHGAPLAAHIVRSVTIARRSISISISPRNALAQRSSFVIFPADLADPSKVELLFAGLHALTYQSPSITFAKLMTAAFPETSFPSPLRP